MKTIQRQIFLNTLIINSCVIFLFGVLSDMLVPHQVQRLPILDFIILTILFFVCIITISSLLSFYVSRKAKYLDSMLSRFIMGKNLGHQEKEIVNKKHYELLKSVFVGQAVVVLVSTIVTVIFLAGQMRLSFAYIFSLFLVLVAFVLLSGLIQVIGLNRVMVKFKQKIKIIRFGENEKSFPIRVKVVLLAIVLCQISAGLVFFQWYNNSLYMIYSSIAVMKYTSEFASKQGNEVFEIPETDISILKERKQSFEARVALIERYLKIAKDGITKAEAQTIKNMVNDFEKSAAITEKSIEIAFNRQIETSAVLMTLFLIFSSMLALFYVKDFNIQIHAIKAKMNDMLTNKTDFSQRISILTIDELGHLSSLFNQILDYHENVNKQLMQVDTLKDEFLANTSHELRTPLNGIIGLSESLLDGVGGKLADVVQKNLSMIVASGKRLNHLINDILDFSRLKNRDIALKKKNVDLHTVSNTILAITQPLMDKKQLVMENLIPMGDPFRVFADEDRMQQIFYNIVGNAIKFTSSGKITLSAAELGSMIEISITDTGMGIPEDRQQRIFESFEQAGANGVYTPAGTGLGLSISKKLVELHGGEIGVQSTPGKGSVFFFTIPKASAGSFEDSTPAKTEINKLPRDLFIPTDETIADTIQTQTLVAGNTEGSSEMENIQVLVVDDEAVNLQVVT
ncbi:HAMP domain-containing histidine kinase, partial [bacterium]|nr:HAMP domain-containing histidine kinase [bacterium]